MLFFLISPSFFIGNAEIVLSTREPINAVGAGVRSEGSSHRGNDRWPTYINFIERTPEVSGNTRWPFAEETGGVSIFYKDTNGEVYHTYSTYGRGCEPIQLPYYVLDLVLKGRLEEGLLYTTAWLRHPHRYDA